MTLQEVYRTAYKQSALNAQDKQVCAFDISCLFEHAMGVSRGRLPIIGDTAADPRKAATFFELCTRYNAGEPLQYLLGEWEFYGLAFEVGKGVLIPRSDTETLVEHALTRIQHVQSPVIADLCAGSGCVAVSLAHVRSDAQLFALELSEQAFAYLKRNIARHRVSVQAVLCDVLTPPVLPPLDLVVCNPPYIARDEMQELSEQVRQEPEMALTDGADGYGFYKALPALYAPCLKPGGVLAFEVGYTQAQTVADILVHHGYTDIALEKDLAGITRVVSGKMSEARRA